MAQNIWKAIAEQAKSFAEQHNALVEKYKAARVSAKTRRENKATEIAANVEAAHKATEMVTPLVEMVESIEQDTPEYVLFVSALEALVTRHSEFRDAALDILIEKDSDGASVSTETMKAEIETLAASYKALAEGLKVSDPALFEGIPALEKLSKGGRPAGSKNGVKATQQVFSIDGEIHTAKTLGQFVKDATGLTVAEFLEVSGLDKETASAREWSYSHKGKTLAGNPTENNDDSSDENENAEEGDIEQSA